MCVPEIFYLDNTLLWQCFILFCSERKEKTQSVPRASRWKSESQSVKTHHGSGKKNNFKHMLGNYCYHRHPFLEWSSDCEKRTAQENISNKKKGKSNNLGFFSQVVIFKCNLLDGFISKTQCKVKAHRVIPDTAALSYTPIRNLLLG